MIKDIRVGICFSDEKTQVAVVEFGPDGTELRYLEEILRTAEQPLTYLPEATLKSLNSFGKFSKVGVSIESGNAVSQIFPMDTTLPEASQEEQLDWEWKNYFPEYSSSDFLRSKRVLTTDAEAQTSQILSSIIKHSLLNEIKSAIQGYKIQAGTIELISSNAENVLRFIHPELKNKNVAMVGVSPMRLDVHVFVSGKLSAYKYGIGLQPKEAVDFLANELLEYLPETLYIYGSALTYEWQKALKSSLGVVLTLNPFRKFRITPEVKNFSKYLGHEHRFCGCIGGIIDNESVKGGR